MQGIISCFNGDSWVSVADFHWIVRATPDPTVRPTASLLVVRSWGPRLDPASCRAIGAMIPDSAGSVRPVAGRVSSSPGFRMSEATPNPATVETIRCQLPEHSYDITLCHMSDGCATMPP